MSAPEATILIPTTGDRGPLLKHSVGSVLAQTEQNLEILIVGDGVSDESKEQIEAVAASDSRIRFFNFPKHESRGEPNRDQVLRHEASGRIVCYLSDRDLMLSDHLETVGRHLRDNDLVFAFFIACAPEKLDPFVGNFTRPFHFGPIQTGPGGDRLAYVPTMLSCVTHTRDMYLRLPHGWRTTPEGRPTDRYMCRQFASQPECRLYACNVPTVFWFKRKHHPGWPAWRRLRELEYWSRYLEEHDLETLRNWASCGTYRRWWELVRRYEERGLPFEPPPPPPPLPGAEKGEDQIADEN